MARRVPARLARLLFLLTPLLIALGPAASPAALARAASTQALLDPDLAYDQPIDEAYTEEIRRHTTDPAFLTPVVDALPASDTVPTPLEHHGYIAGAEGHLTYAADVHAYMRAVAEASPRVSVMSMGMSEEGRERLLVVAASEETIANLERYREITARLADPRNTTDAEAAELITEGKAIYWATGGLHSPETGSPEMLMELVYRFAADERPVFDTIRDNVIVMITPVVEVDGRERIIDIMRYREANPGKPTPSLVYWGKYAAHDNNRDGIGLALSLSRQAIATAIDWHPQVMHDLHESVPFLYIMSGHGPFNAWLDPITTEEWVEMAWTEVRQMNEWNVPGVWTFNFFDGWAANYMIYAALGRNGVGRFYETFGNSVPDTMIREIGSQSNRAWYRMNPPTPKVLWSLRNNTNLMQSGLVVGLHNVAENRERVLDTFWRKGKRAVEKPEREGPAAYVIPADGARPRLTRRLVGLLGQQTIEVHTATEDFEAEASIGPRDDATSVGFAAGDWIVRMDQPYSRLADMLLDYQYYDPNDPRPYDDTGWTLGEAFNVEVYRVADPAVLETAMEPAGTEWIGGTNVASTVDTDWHADPDGRWLLLPPTGEPEIATFRFRLADVPMHAINAADDGEEEMEGEDDGDEMDDPEDDDRDEPTWRGRELDDLPGTIVIDTEGIDRERVLSTAADLGLELFGTDERPDETMHEMTVPRVAMVHTWQNTQSEGWWRYALDALEIPFDYVSTDEIREIDDLGSRWDVMILAPGWGNVDGIVHGARSREPIPWRTTELTPNLGQLDSTDDMTAGIGFEGVAKIQRFAEGGGVIVAATSSAGFLIETGIAPYVRSDDVPGDLQARGAIFRGTVSDPTSPIAYGYEGDTALYFSGGPLLAVSAGPGGFGGFGGGGTSGSGRRGEMLVPGHPPYEDPEGESEPPSRDEPYFNDGSDLDDRMRQLVGHLVPDADAVPRIVMRFGPDADDLLLSGMLGNGRALASRPAVVDVPVGEGHAVLFATNPMWRNQTWGLYSLVLNTLLHHDALDAGR